MTFEQITDKKIFGLPVIELIAIMVGCLLANYVTEHLIHIETTWLNMVVYLGLWVVGIVLTAIVVAAFVAITERNKK